MIIEIEGETMANKKTEIPIPIRRREAKDQ
jgi:hypothetical protein